LRRVRARAITLKSCSVAFFVGDFVDISGFR
jgi:hypothetical protein